MPYIPRDVPDLKHVRCEECLKEIPVSEAKNVEAVEYVVYFCGLECYDKWKRGADEEGKQEPSE